MTDKSQNIEEYNIILRMSEEDWDYLNAVLRASRLSNAQIGFNFIADKIVEVGQAGYIMHGPLPYVLPNGTIHYPTKMSRNIVQRQKEAAKKAKEWEEFDER